MQTKYEWNIPENPETRKLEYDENIEFKDSLS